ncbi:DNA polymerase III subunit delta' [Streptococcus oricebi]|uniref:DNA polymerase III subunit delta n=1 Tax=Streptococcus oricebi TaxID=1547447 RepID=A0ABS5B4A3_9STRE|nr:DNA polymerase III subunit delta' [Streptococcus oricebi]MBP2623351.1 DNA polymerase III subunit delta' [Streptococcus oricebi]
MKVEEIRDLQPQLLANFQQILEQDRLSHAYLFSGNFASFELAILLAQTLFCPEKKDTWACGTCRSCRLIAEEDFSDLTILRPVNNLIKTERVRDLLRNFSQTGLESQQQVFIIDQAEKMHANAANSLLKVIEEPQTDIYIFFLTSDEYHILPTIKSRTQLFHFPKNQAYLQELLERQGLVKTEARLLATYSQSLGEAQSLAKTSGFFSLASECQTLIKLGLDGTNQAYLQAGKLSSLAEDKDKQGQVFRLLEIYLAQQKTHPRGFAYLERLFKAQQMWRANVSFQNCLEYLWLG